MVKLEKLHCLGLWLCIVSMFKHDTFQMVLPGGTGEKDRTGISHESFLLMANSQSEMEEWVRAIRRVIWAPLGGGEIQMSFDIII